VITDNKENSKENNSFDHWTNTYASGILLGAGYRMVNKRPDEDEFCTHPAKHGLWSTGWLVQGRE
jgi:hypothetical protein